MNMQLTETEKQTLQGGDAVPVTIDHTDCVLIRRDVYERVRAIYDDSDWTDGEIQAMAAYAAEAADDPTPIQ